MKKSEWNDKQLEEMLQSMPKVSDRQSPDALYRKIQARLQEEQVQQNTKKKTWVLPSIATVAALFLIFLISSNMMDIQNLGSGSEDKAQMEKSAIQDPGKPQSEGSMEAKITENSDDAVLKEESGETGPNSIMMSVEDQTVSLVNKVPSGQTLITVGVKEYNVNFSFPISFLYSDSQMTKFEMLKDAISKLQDEDLGVNNEMKNFTLEEISDTEIKIILSNDQIVSASAQEISSSIIETFRWMNYQRAQVVYEDGRQVEDSMSGGTVGPFEMEKNLGKGYVIHHTLTGNVFLVPTLSPSNSFKEALEIMTQPAASIIPSIEQGLIENVTSEGKTVTIKFATEIENTTKHDLMLKAILLTAKEFEFESVKFENTVEQIGEYSLKDKNGKALPIGVPIAPNYMEIPNK